jgi:hypothetical protein
VRSFHVAALPRRANTIARKLGLDVGIDWARGPDDNAYYLQVGTAWR